MKPLITILALLCALFFTSCEERQRTIRQGDLIKCPILDKFSQGTNNPSKGLKKRHYLKIHIQPSGEERRIIVDKLTYNAVNIGDKVHGYYLDGNFVLARGQL